MPGPLPSSRPIPLPPPLRLFESHAIGFGHKVARPAGDTTRRGTAPRSVQCCVPRVRGTRHAHAVSNKWRDRRVWSHLRGCLSFSREASPDRGCISGLGPICIGPPCRDTDMDLTRISSPPIRYPFMYENRRVGRENGVRKKTRARVSDWSLRNTLECWEEFQILP